MLCQEAIHATNVPARNHYGDPEGSEPVIADLQRLREKGEKYVVFTSNTAWWLDLFPEFRQYLHANSALIAATPSLAFIASIQFRNEK